ncbi:MAG TPA: SMP-30/gluconolactonase/LRE family protein [Bryobacterales bacterium]|nr:SMP-30/gluconolactonase/LRE family protein [Bryobacterales bacterium]
MKNWLGAAIVLAAVAGLALGAQPAGVGSIQRADPAIDRLVPAGAKIEKLAGNFKFTEGPIWIHAGYLLFSDIPANSIMKWTPDGKVSVFRHPVFPGKFPEGQLIGSNGLTLDHQGRLISCEHGNRRVARTEKDGKITVLADRYEGKRLSSPNDAVVSKAGHIYFTDPPYGLAKQDDDPAKETPFNGVYRIVTPGKPELLIRDMTRPNGLGFSPDEKKFYVGNSDPNQKIWRVYDVKPDGTLANGKLFYDVTKEAAEGLPDGMKLDTRGNLYCTGPGGIWVFSPQGKHLGTIAPPEVPANLNWGDADGKTLYITARTGLYRIRTSAVGIRP